MSGGRGRRRLLGRLIGRLGWLLRVAVLEEGCLQIVDTTQHRLHALINQQCRRRLMQLCLVFAVPLHHCRFHCIDWR